MIITNHVRLIFDDDEIIEATSRNNTIIHIAHYASIEDFNRNEAKNELFLPMEFLKTVIQTFDLTNLYKEYK